MRMSEEQRKRWRAFRRNRRGWVSLAILVTLVILSLFAEFYANSKPILVRYEGRYYAPILFTYTEITFGGDFPSEPDYRDAYIRERITNHGNWALYPVIPWDYKTINFQLSQPAPSPPSRVNWLGTDDRGRDVLARLIYGFRISIFFGVVLAVIGTALGIAIGALQGYFGGWIDLLGEIVGGGRYEDLVANSVLIEAFGLRCRILDLETLIRTKRAAGRPKDFEVLAELEALPERAKR